MSRIEDAVQKLQARSRRPAAPPTPKLATIAPRQHTYGGRAVHFNTAELRANGLLVGDSDQRRLAEQYRGIKRPLLRNADPNLEPPLPRANLVMVASATSGEGKTFTCLNLCLSIARDPDWNVVLVDGDCSKAHLTRLFGAEKEPGLMELLRNPELTFDSLVMPTDIEGLSFLPAGARDPDVSELLASKRMDELCDELSSGGGGRLIVFDSAPQLLTTEGPVLASKVGQVAFVVRANETPQAAVLAALEKLDHSKAIGCVLNQTWGATDIADYGYYGYGEPRSET